MSDFKDKSEQVLEDGKAARATFQPPVDSAPLRAYQYWLKSTGREPFRDNFCHFWRVVLIWAPLHWVADHTLVPLFTSRPIRAVGRGIAWVFQKPVRSYKALHYDTRKTIGNVAAYIFMALLALLFLFALVSLAVKIGVVNFLLVILGALAIVAVLFGVVWVFGRIAEHNRAKARLRADERRKYLNSLSYDEWRLAVGLDSPPRKPRWYDKYLAKLDKGLKNVGDFLVLAVNVVRVNKWKICPLVEIPDSQPNRVDNGVTGW